MTAPAAGTRSTPAGVDMEDGWVTKIGFSQDVDISIWEESVKPPGTDGGDPIDLKTMWSEDWETFAPKGLKKSTDGNVKFSYDPSCTAQINAIVNVKGTITIFYPNGGTLAFFGYVKSVDFDDLAYGSKPKGTLVIVVTNRDPSTGGEEGPVYAPPPAAPMGVEEASAQARQDAEHVGRQAS